MNQTLSKMSVLICLGIGFCYMAHAQQINNPTHIPNELVNKVTFVRLKALVSEAEVRDEVDDALRGFGLNNLEPANECSVAIGNTQVTNSLSGVERDVIVVGDVVNVCN